MADNQHNSKNVTKPSYSKLNIEIPACRELSRKEIMGYRLMYPNSGNLQNNFTTISAEGGKDGNETQKLEPNHKIEDLPLGSKLPHISGNQVTLQTTAIGKRLQKPSCDFDISTPKETYVNNEYNDLHDPHLTSYFQKNESLKQHLIDMGYITENGAVICSLQKYNLYRQYLKRLSIDLLNKKYHEQFTQEIDKRKEQQAKAIEDKKNSEYNAINVRINDAKSRRYELDAAKEDKYKSQQVHLEEKFALADALSKQTEVVRQRNRVKNEEAREKRKQIQIQKELKEQKRIHELVLKKHYEDQKRIFELTKKKKKTMQLRKQRLEENFDRKTEYHKHKQAQLVILAAEHETRRQTRVSQWEDYFNEQLRIQQERLAKIREKQHALRQAAQADKRRASMGEHGDHMTSGSDSDTYSITQLSSIGSMDSMASTATVLGHRSNYILKQVFHSLKYNLPSLMQAMEDYEMDHGMPLSDLAMHYLICKINTEGIVGAKILYDKENEQFEIIGGKAGHLKFHIHCEDLIEGAGYRRRTDSFLARRNTPACLGLGENMSETIMEENETDDVNEELLNTTVKALSYKVVKRVMKNCGLKVAAADVMGVTMSILNRIGEANFEFSDDSTSEASSATESTASSHAHSITMHDMADRFIMHLLGLDSDRSTTEISHSILTGEDMGTTDTETHRSALLDHEDINQIALDVVREALNKQNDELDKDKQFLIDGTEFSAGVTSENFSNLDDAQNLEKVKDDITKRIRGLTSNMVKNVVQNKVKDGDICEQSLVSQDVLYIENRVQNLADNILVSLIPGLEPEKTPKKNKKTASARSKNGKRSARSAKSGASSARAGSQYTGRTTPSSQLSTLPDCYDNKVNSYTTRIIETLLNMKRIMPHPKQRMADQDRTAIGAIARCINFEELYKAPKAAFNLDANEISALAQNLADKISFLDTMDTPSERESPREGLVGQLAEDIMGKPTLGDTKKTYSPVPISSSSDMSDVANDMVQDIIKKGKFRIPLDILSEAGSSLADQVLDHEMNRAQQHAQDSAESALEEMAKDAHGLADLLVQAAVDDEKDSVSEVDSVDSIADRLAGLIVDYGEEKYLKENLDQKAKHVGREVSTIAHDLIKELLQSAKSTSVGTSTKESYLKGSMSLTSTATLESVLSEAIGALAATCIKSDPSDEYILRNKSEVALRNLLRALQHNFRDDNEDAHSVGSSGASILADDLASTIIDRTEKTMNLHDFGTVTKPDWRVTRGVQVDGKPVQRQANELMTAILGELNEVTPSERTLQTHSSTGFDDMDEAATQVSKLLVKKLVPTLVEHFRPPTPPKVREAGMSCVPKTQENAMATSSCFADFRKAGIAKRKQVKLVDLSSTSQSSVYYSDSERDETSAKDTLTFSHSQTLSSQSKFANRVDQLANDIVTKAMKDDLANNNLRKGVQIQGLVNDLALGIVETVLAKNHQENTKSPRHKKQSKKSGQSKKPSGPSADKMLEKALYRQKQSKKQGDKKIDDLAGNLISRINERQSGSSRMDSGRSHDSEVERLLKGVHDGLPNALNISPSPRSGESDMADNLIPNQIEGLSPRSNSTGSSFGGKLLDQLVNGSIIDGQMSTKSGASSIAEDLVAQSMKYGMRSTTQTEGSELIENLIAASVAQGAANTKSDQSSVAENLINQAYDDAQQSTVSTGESYVEKMIAKSIIDNIGTTVSTKSSFAEKIVAAGFKTGEKQALSKSPCSSVAEDIVRNLSGIASSKSEASHLAEDLLEHVQDDLNPNDRNLIKSAGTSKSAGTNLASDIANSIIRGLDQKESSMSKMELPKSKTNFAESKTVSKSSLPKSKISLRPTSGQKSKTGSKMSLPKSRTNLDK